MVKEGFMRLNIFFKFLLLFQVVFSFNVLADTCVSLSSVSTPREGEAIRIASTEKAHLNEVEALNAILADSIDIEFWVEQCTNNNGIEYSLIGTVTPTVPGRSKGAGVYNIAIIQNDKQYDGAFYFTNNLFISSDFWTALITIYFSSGSITSIPSGFDLSQPFTLILSCNNLSFYEECSAVNSVRLFELNPQPVTDSPTISSVNGTWYDPEYSGSGFTMMQTPIGFVMFYYGYKAEANGETLWLLSSTGPKVINKGETFTLDMLSGFLGNGGSLTTKPNTENSGTRIWGTTEVTFNTCNSGVIKLTNNDGITVTHNINLLAGVDELTCRD